MPSPDIDSNRLITIGDWCRCLRRVLTPTGWLSSGIATGAFAGYWLQQIDYHRGLMSMPSPGIDSNELITIEYCLSMPSPGTNSNRLTTIRDCCRCLRWVLIPTDWLPSGIVVHAFARYWLQWIDYHRGLMLMPSPSTDSNGLIPIGNWYRCLCRILTLTDCLSLG